MMEDAEISIRKQAVRRSGDDLVFSQLRTDTWFGSLPLALAEAMFRAGHLEEYDAGRTIFLEGAPAEGLHGIIDGAVHLERVCISGQRVLIHAASRGAWVGEAATFSPRPLTLTARAVKQTRTWHIPSFAVLRLLDQQPEMLHALGVLMAKHFSMLLDVICMTLRPSTVSQVAGRLILLDRLRNENAKGRSMAEIAITQSDLADMTGHSRQTINAVIRRLAREGLVKVGYQRIEVCDPEALSARFCPDLE